MSSWGLEMSVYMVVANDFHHGYSIVSIWGRKTSAIIEALTVQYCTGLNDYQFDMSYVIYRLRRSS